MKLLFKLIYAEKCKELTKKGHSTRKLSTLIILTIVIQMTKIHFKEG